MSKSKSQGVALLEFTQGIGGERVDREAGVVRGVKIIGIHSANKTEGLKREYPREVLSKAIPLYEGARVNINHPNGKPEQSRDYRDRFGSLKGVQLREDGLYGDLHFNPKHSLAEQFAWDAENAPHNVGLSQNAHGRVACRNGKALVEEIWKVHSVDVVGNPATTNGLFEDIQEPSPSDTNSGDSVMSEQLQESLAEAQSQLKEQSTKLTEQAEQLAKLQEQLETEKTARAKDADLASCRSLLEASNVQDAGEFIEAVSLLAADKRAAFVAKLPKKPAAQPTRSGAPLVEQKEIEAAKDAESFVKAICLN